MSARLPERQAALRRAAHLAEDRVAAAALEHVEEALDRLAERAERAPDRTVVALLGATGSGKSALFNALVGEEIAQVSAARPSTSRPLAAIWGAGAAELLDWLDVTQRVEFPDDGTGLILLDLPDIDSTEAAHHQIAARLAEAVDVLVWVLDPQKYADALVHQQYLRPLAANAPSSLVVLNQVDRLEKAERRAVTADLARLLSDDAQPNTPVLSTSALTGEGVRALRSRLVQVARGRRARLERAAGDVTRAAVALEAAAEGAPAVETHIGASEVAALNAAAAHAAGVPLILAAVRRSYVQRARRHVGWIPVRWVSRLRPNAMQRLHLGASAPPGGPAAGSAVEVAAEVAAGELPGGAPSSLPGPTLVQAAAVRSAAIDLASNATVKLPAAWRQTALTEAQARIPAVITGLDTTIAGVDFEQDRQPWWWRVLGWLQIGLFWVALAGAAWLGVLAVFRYLDLPAPGTPVVVWGAEPPFELPVPTALLSAGVGAGILFALLGMLLARGGARLAVRRANKRLTQVVNESVRSWLVTPLETELSDYHLFRASLQDALRP